MLKTPGPTHYYRIILDPRHREPIQRDPGLPASPPGRERRSYRSTGGVDVDVYRHINASDVMMDSLLDFTG